MSENKNDSFRDKNIKGKIVTVIGIAILFLLVLGFVIGLLFFGFAGIFELLGVQYQSFWSLLIFVVSFFILGLVVDLFSIAIFKLTSQHLTRKVKVFYKFSIESIFNWIALFTVDECMSSITLSINTEMIIASLLAVLEIVFDKDKD
ncbi:regulatory YrvL family protein [Bacillus suaedae]|uniref:Regulatory YrvL family protein n=1 Tax=Halalkalibacter suaedae TaxID=2822140 RepID=A0A940WU09_9BACI|nr:regulatory YrvL family protein [Bacillus suaedae]MBP3950208.1 regulatory YrvL family protein [Bacillus suaedae]